MTSFSELKINNEILEGLKKQKITVPTKIQSSAIPPILEGLDVIGESETGSGKTLAYLIPLIEKINYDKKENQIIVLTPTHELAIQVNKVIEELRENSNLNLTSTVIIGNVNIKRQVENLKAKPQFIIGSPGRILELIKLRKISAHTVKTIVIDECDKLLDENNYDTVGAVIKTTLRERQLLMFSATITDEVITRGKELMKDPKIIKEKALSKINENIEHIFMVCDRRDKVLVLRKLMAALKPKKAIAFINKTDEIEILSSKLKFHGLKADGIHGAFVKNERKKVMEDFKSGKINLLVASDVAARGLDIEGVTHVFNIDVPEDSKDYLHRCGRTGRVNNKGIAISIVTEREMAILKSLENKFNIKIQYKELSFGRMVNSEYIANSKPKVDLKESKEKSSRSFSKEQRKPERKYENSKEGYKDRSNRGDGGNRTSFKRNSTKKS